MVVASSFESCRRAGMEAPILRMIPFTSIPFLESSVSLP